MMRIVSNSEINPGKWQDYVDSHDLGTIFHTPFMFDIYAQTKGYNPFALFVVDDAESIIAMLLGYIQTVFKGNISNMNKRLVLMNSPIYNSREALDYLLANFKTNFIKSGLYTEVRNHYDLSDVAEIYLKHGFEYEEHLNILIDLSKDEDTLFADMSSRRRKEVRHGAKEQFEFKIVEKQDYENFYLILKDIYIHAKLPLVDESYFQALWKDNSENRVILGLYDLDILVGAVLLFSYKKIIYSVFGGSKSVYYSRRPNDYMFWQVFQWAKQNGFKMYDWLGAGNPNKPYGVRDWKKQFGGTIVNYGRYKLIHSPMKFKLAEIGFRLVQKVNGWK